MNRVSRSYRICRYFHLHTPLRLRFARGADACQLKPMICPCIWSINKYNNGVVCGGRCLVRHLTRRTNESRFEFRATDAWWYVRLKSTQPLLFVWIYLRFAWAQFYLTEHATHLLLLFFLHCLWSSFAYGMNNDRSACRFLKQKDLMTQRNTQHFTCFSEVMAVGTKKRDSKKWKKNWKREDVFTNHDTCCGAATVASVVIACIVFFPSRIIIIYEVLEQNKSWKSMACIDVIIIMRTNNVYVHFGIRNRWCATPLNAAVISSAEACLLGTFGFNTDFAGLKNQILYI